ncbi:hypothetical protein BKA65DRAFT_89323 [Rhexocercosporidium sp. MPI-PUGE-AT-0058]|nr:hypothetical protein BKA65DRAFT_89323 [Rhexocercosporidium sp. MPI-PUGE-AT-0058]
MPRYLKAMKLRLIIHVAKLERKKDIYLQSKRKIERSERLRHTSSARPFPWRNVRHMERNGTRSALSNTADISLQYIVTSAVHQRSQFSLILQRCKYIRCCWKQSEVPRRRRTRWWRRRIVRHRARAEIGNVFGCPNHCLLPIPQHSLFLRNESLFLRTGGDGVVDGRRGGRRADRLAVKLSLGRGTARVTGIRIIFTRVSVFRLSEDSVGSFRST